jgi:hypothetical protein
LKAAKSNLKLNRIFWKPWLLEILARKMVAKHGMT